VTALEVLPVSAVLLDIGGKIVGVNKAWKDFGRRNGLCLPNFGVGSNYLAYCGTSPAGSVAKDLRELLAGRRDLVTSVYPCNSPGEKRWFMLLAFPLSLSEPSGIAIVHIDISSLVPLPVIETVPGRRGHRTKADSEFRSIAQTVQQTVSQSISLQLQQMLTPVGKSKGTVKANPARETEPIFPRARLTRRQMEVLSLLGEGKTNAEIAQALCRSPHTIKLHIAAILRKLNLRTRTEAALLAAKLPRKAR
jgi:DNA-binding CsgD family transcriptional regulator